MEDEFDLDRELNTLIILDRDTTPLLQEIARLKELHFVDKEQNQERISFEDLEMNISVTLQEKSEE